MWHQRNASYYKFLFYILWTLGYMDNTAPYISRELEIFFNEHNKTCTNCGKKFQEDMVANVGYLVEKTPAVL